MLFALLGFGLTWDQLVTPFFLPISHFWNGNVYPMPLLPLYFRRLVFRFHKSTHGEEFCPKKDHTPVAHIADLDD